jgi:hypothetical protein
MKAMAVFFISVLIMVVFSKGLSLVATLKVLTESLIY